MPLGVSPQTNAARAGPGMRQLERHCRGYATSALAAILPAPRGDAELDQPLFSNNRAFCAALRVMHDRQFGRREPHVLESARGDPACVKAPTEKQNIHSHEWRNGPRAAQDKHQRKREIDARNKQQNGKKDPGTHWRIGPEHGIEKDRILGHDHNERMASARVPDKVQKKPALRGLSHPSNLPMSGRRTPAAALIFGAPAVLLPPWVSQIQCAGIGHCADGSSGRCTDRRAGCRISGCRTNCSTRCCQSGAKTRRDGQVGASCSLACESEGYYFRRGQITAGQ